MRIRTRIMSVLLACGILPMVAVGVVCYSLAVESSNGMAADSVAELTTRATAQLDSSSLARRSGLERYFHTVGGHVKSLAQQVSTATAVIDFGVALGGIADGVDVDAARKELAASYVGAFAKEYQAQMGRPCDAERFLAAQDETAVVAQLHYVQRNPHPVGKKCDLVESPDESLYSAMHAQVHPGLLSTQRGFGYHDIFLIDMSGRVVYSVFKELDFATSLRDGPWATSALGKLFTQLESAPAEQLAFSDFCLYTPSYDAPAAFLGAPIERNGRRCGYLVVQLPLEKINQIASNTDGLGETGEVVLVGADHLMRSDSRRAPGTHGCTVSFRRPETGRFELPQTDKALAGESGSGIVADPAGGEDLVTWCPVDAFGTRWAMVSRMAKTEILAGAGKIAAVAHEGEARMLQWTLSIMLAVGVVVGLVSWFLARQICTPIARTVAALRDIADGEGDLRARLDEARRDELGELGGWFNKFLGKLQTAIRIVIDRANDLRAASQQLTGTAQSLNEGADATKQQTQQVAAAAEQMSANMSSVSQSSESVSGTFRTVAAAVEELTASIGEVAKSSANAASIAETAAAVTRGSNEKITALGAAANEIGRVIEAIQDIAEQTNLLALNATIEAARAGEAGKGFSVVANEVKDLARQTAEATQDIRQRIERIQATTADSVRSISEIDQVILKVTTNSQSIAAAVTEQRAATEEIASSLSQSSRSLETVTANIGMSFTASQEVTKAVSAVDQQTRTTAAGAEQALQAGRSLATLAGELQKVVDQFKV